MQRLFTTFADGWPGSGLLIQRVVTGTVLIHHGTVLFSDATTPATMALRAIGVPLGVFIFAGIWTPITGMLIAGVEVWLAFVCPGSPATAMLLAMLGATLAMIGPGAFSVDARLFGRRQIGV